ncbi:MAG: NAD(P)H-hydrate dehydratase [Desulfobacterales bacterium]
MFAVIGTIPHDDFPLTAAAASKRDGFLQVRDQSIDINRGTPALIAAAEMACRCFNEPAPFVYLIGDTGRGAGSRELYRHLSEDLPDRRFTGLTFHYIQPDVDWHNKILFAVDRMEARPVLVADAGFMYAAKMSGRASDYDVFTPDVGELAFLADDTAPHPFYTRGFIFHDEKRVPELITAAYAHDNAARYLLVKGETDILANAGGVVDFVSEPMVPSLEAIGGTGDVITGLVAAFTGMGKDMKAACLSACRISRLAGKMANPHPGTQVIEIIERIPEVLKRSGF